MDEREIARRAEVLPDRFADRVGDELDILRDHADGGEYEELLDDLVATLSKNRAPVSPGERDELRALLEALKMSAAAVDQLNVTG